MNEAQKLVLFLLISHTSFICKVKVLDASDMLPNAIVGDLMDFIVEVRSEHPAWVYVHKAPPVMGWASSTIFSGHQIKSNDI